jgi:hypothetical protein
MRGFLDRAAESLATSNELKESTTSRRGLLKRAARVAAGGLAAVGMAAVATEGAAAAYTLAITGYGTHCRYGPSTAYGYDSAKDTYCNDSVTFVNWTESGGWVPANSCVGGSYKWHQTQVSGCWISQTLVAYSPGGCCV